MVIPKIEIQNTFSPALAQAFSDSRLRPDIARAVNLIMRDWVSFAINKIPKAQKAQIKARLEAPATRAKFNVTEKRMTPSGRESSGSRYKMLRGSVAAHIVWSTNYPMTNQRRASKWAGKTARNGGGGQFYALVGSFIARRQYSAGYLKSGLYPALNRFRAARGEDTRSASYRRYGAPGMAKTAEPGERVPMAEVENWAKGILERAPDAFEASLPEITARIEMYIAENLVERAKRAGLNAKME